LKRGASSLAFLPDGRTLLAADFRGVRVVNTEDWTERQSLPGSSSPMTLSSNSTWLATGGREGVRIWDTATWKEVQTLIDATSPVSFAPDGESIVADSRDGSGLMVWNLKDATNQVLLAGSTNLFLRRFGFRNDRALAFSPDGQWIVAARNTPSEHGVFVLGIWDASTGEEVEVMPGDPENPAHTGGITSIVFSPDGRTMATASMDYSIRLWDFEKRQRIATLHGHLNEVLAIAFSRDGRQIVSGARGGGVKLWPTRPQPKDEEFAGARVPLTFSTNSAILAALSRQNSVLFLDLSTDAIVDEFPLEAPRFMGGVAIGGPGPGGPVFRGRLSMLAAVSADLKTIATPQFDGSVKLLNTSTRATNFLRGSGQPISAFALSPDGRTIVTGGWEGGLRWWDVRQGTNTAFESEGERALFSGDSRTLALFNRGGIIELWNVATRSLRTNLLVEPPPSAGGASGTAASFSPDGKSLAVACQDDAIRVWDVATAALIGTLTGHKQSIYTVAFAPDGTTIASASDDSTLKFWNVPTQQELLTITRLGGGLRALTFSPDGRSLVAGTSSTLVSGGLRIFRAPTLQEIDAAEARASTALDASR
jgi:WD40 repeat protein